MTLEQLIAEGRALERPCVFLRPQGTGPVAAMWYEWDRDEVDATQHRGWLTVDAQHIPGLANVNGYLSVYSNEEDCTSGRVQVTPDWPQRPVTKLYAHPTSVLPPLDAVFSRGSAAVGEWLAANNWKPEWRYNTNFKAREIADAYEDLWGKQYPIYRREDIYAVLGGWHWPGADHDWHDLVDETLMVLTIKGSEPWVEAWQTRTGDFKVIQRST